MKIGLCAAFLFILGGCYAHTPGPGPSCADAPSQPGCLSPIHDNKRPDAGTKEPK